ncbi:MAG: NifB/NifX family molybdenum-iron cluster-binding protein, partial [Desulfobacterales bacterium]
DNHDLNHAHGKCQPLVALGGKTVDAVVVGGIGGGALKKLTEEGVKTYRAVEGTVSENLSLIKDGKLPEFTLDHTCKGHQHGIGECVH